MIGEIPEFYKNGHLQEIDGYEFLDDDASDADKREYEEYFNDEYSKREYREMYPNMKDPYRMWNGHIVDKGAED